MANTEDQESTLAERMSFPIGYYPEDPEPLPPVETAEEFGEFLRNFGKPKPTARRRMEMDEP